MPVEIIFISGRNCLPGWLIWTQLISLAFGTRLQMMTLAASPCLRCIRPSSAPSSFYFPSSIDCTESGALGFCIWNINVPSSPLEGASTKLKVSWDPSLDKEPLLVLAGQPAGFEKRLPWLLVQTFTKPREHPRQSSVELPGALLLLSPPQVHTWEADGQCSLVKSV